MDAHAVGMTRREMLLAGAFANPFVGRRIAASRRSSVIVLWMNGGPSQWDTFAPEPELTPFRLVATSARGVQFTTHLPRLADRAHRLAILRDVVVPEANHRRAWYLVHTGQRAPLTLVPPPRPGPMLDSLWTTYPRAFLSPVSEAAKRRYGDSPFGRGCLLARRLVEEGAPLVEVELDGWDVHCDSRLRLPALLDTLDGAFAALLDDLAERDLQDTTLVVWMGEFGRTAKLNHLGGTDHDPAHACVVMAGCGVRGGCVHESSGLRIERVLATIRELHARVPERRSSACLSALSRSLTA